MKNTVFFDTESVRISTDFADGWGEKVPTWWDPNKELTDSNVLRMDLSLACTYDNTQIKFWDDPTALLLYLTSDEVDQIVTFNGDHFDFCLLLGCLDEPKKEDGKWIFGEGFRTFYDKLSAKSIDLMLIAQQSLGHRISLDQITSALFNQKKEIDGTQFVPLLKHSNPSERIKAYNYLLCDCVQLYRIYGIAHEFGQCAYRNNLGEVVKFDMKVPSLM